MGSVLTCLRRLGLGYEVCWTLARVRTDALKQSATDTRFKSRYAGSAIEELRLEV